MFSQDDYNKQYYIINKDSIQKNLKNRFNMRIEMVREAKNKSCADCGLHYPYWVMQFDHVRGKKLFNIGMSIWNKGTAKLLEEIKKCDVVCANCHAERSHRRMLEAKSFNREDARLSTV